VSCELELELYHQSSFLTLETGKMEELDAVEILVLIDNELDPISKPIDGLAANGNIAHIGLASPYEGTPPGEAVKQLKMEQICCAAHGLSLLMVRVVDEITFPD
jgi:7,8-dihydropterin-6-yl-methyl-4-(beta-D-ribofuranosyl)aminobenzene 5'-phosphate synthase